MTKESGVTLNDLVSIVGYGDSEENHEQLEALLDKMGEDAIRAMLIRAVYTIDAIRSVG